MDDVYEGTFTAADHTKLVRAVLEHPLHVIKYLNVPSGQSPSTLDVIDAALKVKSFDAVTKARLTAAREGYLQFEAERAQDPTFFTEWVGTVRSALDQPSMADMIAAVDHLLAQKDLDNRSKAGLEFAKAILVDGADSIYSPDFPAYELMETATFTGAHQVAQVDVEFSPGTGAASAAAAGAASAGAAIAVIYEAFFG
jgi:regulator of RNase E activity RraB